jgi:hypothetical protein
MRNQVWDSTFANLHSLDLAEFVFSLGRFDAVDGEATFRIVDKAEVLAGLVDRDHVHVARRVGCVGSHLAIDLDETLHEDSHRLAAIEGVLETIAKEDYQGEAVSSFLLRKLSVLWQVIETSDFAHMRAWRCLRRIGTGKLVEKPVRWRTETLLMFLRTATHLDC